jgi:Winged helix-turn helix
MDRQTLRDWVIRFNDQGADGLINKASPGAPSKLTAEHRASRPPGRGRADPGGARCGAMAGL